MASNVQIICINKTDRQNAHERIKSIGGLKADGTRWKLDLDAAIKGIESDTWKVYVRRQRPKRLGRRRQIRERPQVSEKPE